MDCTDKMHARLMGLFYRQRGLEYPQEPPVMPAPIWSTELEQDPDDNGHRAKCYAGDTFTALCQFWQIVHEFSTKFYGEGTGAMRDDVTLQFAEYKYQELLAWTDGLPSTLERSEDSPHHVVILQFVSCHVACCLLVCANSLSLQ